MLTEYLSLRQESLAAITNRVTVINFIFGALAIVLSALITKPGGAAVGVLALVFVPQLSKVGLLAWLGEYNRSQRAGKWIAELEGRINKALGVEGAMGWEGGLYEKAAHMKYPYLSTMFLMLGLGWASSTFGVFAIATRTGAKGRELAILVTGLVLYTIFVESMFGLFLRKKWREIKGSKTGL